jgi:hypothetical protein
VHDVGALEDGVAAGNADGRDHGRPLALQHVANDHARTFARQHLGTAPPNASRRARHHGHLARHASVHRR